MSLQCKNVSRQTNDVKEFYIITNDSAQLHLTPLHWIYLGKDLNLYNGCITLAVSGTQLRLVFFGFIALLWLYRPFLEGQMLVHLLQMSLTEVGPAKALGCLCSCLACLLIFISAISTCCHLFWLTLQGRSVIAIQQRLELIWEHTYYKSFGLGHNCGGHTLVKWSVESSGILPRLRRWKELRPLYWLMYGGHVSIMDNC